MKYWNFTRSKRELKRFYLKLIPQIREVSRESGYAQSIIKILANDWL